jgi:chromosome partitioning protein
MLVISVVSGKGGVGKTTLASALAVRATRENRGRARVAMVDLDPTGSLAAWWKRRGATKNPEIFGNVDTASEAIERLQLTEAPDYCFIDTPPAFVATMEDAVAHADLVVIPLRPSALDLLGSEDAVLMAREAEVPYLCVINDADPHWTKTIRDGRGYLLTHNVPLAETVVHHRQSYLVAMASGRTGPEIDKSKNKHAETEISSLWEEVKRALAKPKGASRRD